MFCNQRHLTTAVALALLSVAIRGLRAEELVLVKEGVSRAPIILFKDAPPFTRDAADELAEYLGKISGAKPEVIEGDPDPIPEHAIWVGYQPKLRELFPKVRFEFEHPEEILLAANANHLVIAGRDRWDPDHLVVEGRRKKVVGRQQEYGTVNAVYTFLQDYLHVRWLWPGDFGEDIVKRRTIAFAPFEFRYHPQIRARSGLLHYSGLPGGGYGTSREWTRRQRLQLDSLIISGGHGFSGWWEKHHKAHPEYFALQPDGTRSGFPGGKYAKLCQSSRAVRQQWLKDVEEKLKQDPNRTVFNASPNDGWFSGHCVCENCRAWDHPGGELRTFRWQGMGQEYVALSDRHVTFANHCARLLKERYPDKDYYVLMLAYGHSRPAPIKAVPVDNVIISSVANFLLRRGLKDRGSSRGTTHRQQFKNWAKLAPHLMWRPNTGSPAGWQQGQPDVPLTQTIEDFKFIADSNCIGIFIDAVWEHWATQGPLYYVMAQLTWNPQQDGHAILDDYYRRGFGAGADEIKAYWALMENTREAYVSGGRGYPEVYDGAFFDKAYAFLDSANAALAEATDIYRKRVEFVRAGLDYTRLIIDIGAQLARLKKSEGTDYRAERTARANWDEMERICQKHPYSINWGPVRPQTPRMKGLHPDYVSYPTRGKVLPAQATPPRKSRKSAKLVPAEEAGWELAFSDDFDRDELGANWEVVDGKWVIQEGCLRGSGALISARGYPGDRALASQRMEFEVTTDVKVMALSKKGVQLKPRISDLSSFIHAPAFKEGGKQPFEAGTFFQFGGFWNKKNQLRKSGAKLQVDSAPEILVTPGKAHRMVVQNDEGHLSMFVDGKLVIEARQGNPMNDPGHDRVGFYFYTAAKVSQVKVYVKRLEGDWDLE